MESVAITSILCSILCVGAFSALMLLGVPVAFSLLLSALAAGMLSLGPSCLLKLGWTPFAVLNNLDLAPLPLFVLMGCAIAETAMGENLFAAARKWLAGVPAGLVVAGIAGEAVMAASLGTSLACLLVVGQAAVREFQRYGYDKRFGLGAILAGGCLGPLIPPSAPMVIYSVMTGVSLGRLFAAGIIPGIVLALMLMLVAMLVARLKPTVAPREVITFTWREKFSSLKKVWPTVLLILAVLGAIFLGIATPTEAAGVGAVVSLVLAVALYGIRAEGLRRILLETAMVTGMVMLLFVASSFFSYVLGSANVARWLLGAIEALAMPPWIIMVAINTILLILGCFIDPLTITMVCIPVFYPLVTALGFDPVWFGIVFLINTQIGLITPPLGVDTMTASQTFGVPFGELVRGVAPFLATLLAFLALVIAFPQLSLWLPAMMR